MKRLLGAFSFLLLVQPATARSDLTLLGVVPAGQASQDEGQVPGEGTTRVSAAPLAIASACTHLIDRSETGPITLSGRVIVTDTDDGMGVLDLARAGTGIRWFRPLPGGNKSELDISPDGQKVLYTVRTRLDDFENPSEIWEANLDGSSPLRLVTGGKPCGPVWHPDSHGFTHLDLVDRGKLFTMEIPSRRRSRRALTLPSGLKKGPEDPEVSHDGKLVTFKMVVQGDPPDQPSLYVMNADGSNLRRLTGVDPAQRYSDHDPVFSRDNTWIYFERFYGAGDWFGCSQKRSLETPQCQWWGIVGVEIATRRERILLPHDPCGRHWYWLPTVSPDGRLLMFVHHDLLESDRGGITSDLWVLDIQQGITQKVRGSDYSYFFDWTR